MLIDIHRESTQTLEEIGHKGKHLQLLIIILPDVTGSYGENQTRTKTLSLLARKLIFLYMISYIPFFLIGMVKRICETELGIVSQCCQPRAASKLSKQYLENLALKINVKVCSLSFVFHVSHCFLWACKF